MAQCINNYMFKQNKYTKWYYQIIESSRISTVTGYTENHHIIPQSIGGEDTDVNLVTLSARQHFICHWLLTKMTDGRDYYSMINALDCMRRENLYQKRYKNKITSRVFARIREECRNHHSNKFSGTGNPSSKLSKEQVIEIYYSCEPTGILVNRYKISAGQIHSVKRKRSYKKITANISEPPGSGGGKYIRIPLSDETIRKIYLESGNFKYFNDNYKVTRLVIENIKAKKTYKEITNNLGDPGQFIKHKFSIEEVEDIYNSKLSSPKLAKKYGVNSETIRRLRKNKTHIYL